jgi:hypothetical protein
MFERRHVLICTSSKSERGQKYNGKTIYLMDYTCVKEKVHVHLKVYMKISYRSMKINY